MSMTFTQLQDVKNRVIRELANHQTNLTTAESAFAMDQIRLRRGIK